MFRRPTMWPPERGRMPDADPYTMTPTLTRRNPGVAAVLSLVVPGVGQIYNGDFLRGIFWLIVTPGFWIGSGGLLGWVCHLIAAYTAYRRAELRAIPT